MATTTTTTIITIIIMWPIIMEEGIPESTTAVVRIEEVLPAEDPIQRVYAKLETQDLQIMERREFATV